VGDRCAVEVEWLANNVAVVTCPAIPTFAKRVTNVQELGMAVRDAAAWSRDPSRLVDRTAPVRTEIPLDQREVQELVCEECEKRWRRYRRNGRRPKFCDTCFALNYPYQVREPQEIAP
jgi:hypothetical protein